MKTSFKLTVCAALVAVVMFGCGDDEPDVPDVGNDVACGGHNSATHFCDSRDGQVYRYVTIGEQVWMAQDLNYRAPDTEWPMNDDTGEHSVTDKGSWCYENKPDSCAKYGRLYTWYAAIEACPVGWHLPNDAEWGVLISVSDLGKKLKTVDGWDDNGNGTDEFGFSALPSGYYWGNGHFGYVGNMVRWWTALEISENLARSRNIQINGSGDGNNGKDYGFSVRCVRD